MTTSKIDQVNITDILSKLRGQYRDFKKSEPLKSERDYILAELVHGSFEGKDTPRILLMAMAPGHWEEARPEVVEERSIELVGQLNIDPSEWPRFAHVSDGENDKCFELYHPVTHEIDRIPGIALINDYKRLAVDPTYRWSKQIYTKLMHDLDAFHEQVYQTVKDRVSNKNDIIVEVAKILFLESFRVHQKDPIIFDCNGGACDFHEIFTYQYVEKHQKKAVEQIKAAFEHLKGHEDYVVTDDDGEDHPVFDNETHLLLSQPQNCLTLLRAIQDLGPVYDNRGNEIKAQGTLGDVAADVLGRVFDVFLRANFESKGGLGVYLTPNPVKQAALEVAFHDIKKETPEILTARDAQGNPEFRFLDPCCGTYGFGAVAFNYLQSALMEIQGLETSDDIKRNQLFMDMKEHSFIGADSAPMMVMLARVNMALLGAPKAKIFYTQNSLVSESLKPCSADLICTNPPFGTPKFGKGKESQKKAYEKDMNRILEHFRSDLHPVQKGKKEAFEYRSGVSGKAFGSKPDKKGHWKRVKGASIDPAILFIDRCLQLLKPGGRLLIVLPDGVLCNSSDRYVREYIMGKKDEVEGMFHGGKAIVKAVLSLPQDTFKLSGTGAKTSLLYVRKRKAAEDDPERFLDEPQEDVFMAVADTLGYVVKNNVEDYSVGVPNDLATIVGAYVRGE